MSDGSENLSVRKAGLISPFFRKTKKKIRLWRLLRGVVWLVNFLIPS